MLKTTTPTRIRVGVVVNQDIAETMPREQRCHDSTTVNIAEKPEGDEAMLVAFRPTYSVT